MKTKILKRGKLRYEFSPHAYDEMCTVIWIKYETKFGIENIGKVVCRSWNRDFYLDINARKNLTKRIHKDCQEIVKKYFKDTKEVFI